MNARAALLALGCVLLPVGCGESAPKPPAVVSIRVLDEVKTPVEGAEIVASGEVVARTDADGRAEIAVSGREGATFSVDVRCPPLYRSPTSPLGIRRIEGAAPATPEYVARCSRTRHTLVVAVRTDGGADMPVLHLGKEVARTDESGSAHVLIDGEVHERVELQIGTDDPKHVKLHPQNPLAAFEVPDRDDIQVFEVKFTRDKKPVVRGAARKAPKAF